MKKFMGVLAILYIIGNHSADAAAENLSITAGALSWYNRFVPVSRIQGMDVPKSSYSVMNGPTMKIQYKDLYVGVTYLISSNDYQLVNTDVPVNVHQSKVSSSASLDEIDAVVGYVLTPRVSLNAGYKGISVKDDLSLLSFGVSYHAKRDESYYLGSLGTNVNIPVVRKLTWLIDGSALLGTFYNHVAYPVYYRRLNEPDTKVTAWGLSVNSSLSYAIINGLSANIGFNYQYIKAGSDNSNFIGPTMGLNYRY